MIKNDLAIFEDHKIRRLYDKETDTWFFSVVDVVQVLTQQADYQTARKYWNKLKERLKKEGSESVTNCHQLKLKAADGKKYLTDVANVETLLRLIQSIPSPKAEPFKLWLAKVGYERIQEIADPERSLNRARDNWRNQDRSDEWIQRRMSGQETRNKLTDYWKDHDIKEGQEYATLTNIIHQECFGSSINKHQKLKGLEKKHNLRDHMTEAELLFTALAELSTRQIAESMNAKGLTENKNASKAGGKIAKTARLELEDKTGQKVISNKNYLKSPKRIT
jgi:DNA-damage-inducible protein D